MTPATLRPRRRVGQTVALLFAGASLAAAQSTPCDPMPASLTFPDTVWGTTDSPAVPGMHGPTCGPGGTLFRNSEGHDRCRFRTITRVGTRTTTPRADCYRTLRVDLQGVQARTIGSDQAYDVNAGAPVAVGPGARSVQLLLHGTGIEWVRSVSWSPGPGRVTIAPAGSFAAGVYGGTCLPKTCLVLDLSDVADIQPSIVHRVTVTTAGGANSDGVNVAVACLKWEDVPADAHVASPEEAQARRQGQAQTAAKCTAGTGTCAIASTPLPAPTRKLVPCT